MNCFTFSLPNKNFFTCLNFSSWNYMIWPHCKSQRGEVENNFETSNYITEQWFNFRWFQGTIEKNHLINLSTCVLLTNICVPSSCNNPTISSFLWSWILGYVTVHEFSINEHLGFSIGSNVVQNQVGPSGGGLAVMRLKLSVWEDNIEPETG